MQIPIIEFIPFRRNTLDKSARFCVPETTFFRPIVITINIRLFDIRFQIGKYRFQIRNRIRPLYTLIHIVGMTDICRSVRNSIRRRHLFYADYRFQRSVEVYVRPKVNGRRRSYIVIAVANAVTYFIRNTVMSLQVADIQHTLLTL